MLPPPYQNTTIADDDLLWILYGVPWSSGTGTIEQLIIEPNKFIGDKPNLLIKCFTKDAAGNTVVSSIQPKVNPQFVVCFNNTRNSTSKKLGIQGIHDTSILTVRQNDLAFDPNETPVGIPSSSVVRITLVPEVGRAYLHWEISQVSPVTPTTPAELVLHIQSSLLAPETILDDYNQRLMDPASNNVTIRYVDSLDNDLPEPRVPTGILVEYLPNREIIYQGDEARNTVVYSCNSDIGNYYYDSNGQLVLVVDSTIVKMY